MRTFGLYKNNFYANDRVSIQSGIYYNINILLKEMSNASSVQGHLQFI